MAMPHQRMHAFLRAGEILWGIVNTKEHMKAWGAKLPERLVLEAELALRHYPSSLELEEAVDEQRSMHTWMARATRDVDQMNEVYDRLRAAAVQLGVNTEWDATWAERRTHNMPLLDRWLYAEHPALGYRAPDDLLDVTGDPEMIVELFRTEEAAMREARGVFHSESKAYRWLRGFDLSLGAIPLEILGSETGRRRVMDELHRLAAGARPAK